MVSLHLPPNNDHEWLDFANWERMEQADAAAEQCMTVPEVAAWVSSNCDRVISEEHAELIDVIA